METKNTFDEIVRTLQLPADEGGSGLSEQEAVERAEKIFQQSAVKARAGRATLPSDRVAQAKAAALAQAFCGAHAPVRAIIMESHSPEEARKKIQAYYADWKPERVNQITEEALQIIAAVGASVAHGN